MKDFQMIYLYVFDIESRQSLTPPTKADINLVSSDCLRIYRWYVDAYEELKIEQGRVIWEKVTEAELCLDAVEEIGEYHA